MYWLPASLRRRPLKLGDRLETVFKTVGVMAAVKAIERKTGKPCGCEQRKTRLNRW